MPLCTYNIYIMAHLRGGKAIFRGGMQIAPFHTVDKMRCNMNSRLHNFLSCVMAERDEALTPPFLAFPPPPPPEPSDFARRHFVALDPMKSL